MKTLRKKPKRKALPALLNGTVPPLRRRNRDVRPREYLTPKEVERLIAAAKKSGRRYGLRDATMILVAFRHGLRVSELCALTWDQIDFSHGLIHVRRMKNGIPSVHQLGGEEMRSLRALKREDGVSRYVFMTERKAPITPAGFRKMLSRLTSVPSSTFRSPRICSDMRVASNSPMMAGTRGPSSTILATRTSCTLC